LEAFRAWWVKKPLDAEAMHEAAQRLVGTHDFTTFRATQCQAKSPVKSLDHLSVLRNGEIIEIRASARSFLHNQVRSMVGSLRKVGLGQWTK
ncbi:tRNA pseudouridine synthase A, partial [Mycobacterium tuberculosis]|nr:tRNA pseudouridine synthase A [Mycobacterium tuberculosis]